MPRGLTVDWISEAQLNKGSRRHPIYDDKEKREAQMTDDPFVKRPILSPLRKGFKGILLAG